MTHELPQMQNCVIEHIEFVDCAFNNRGHSAIKGLIVSTVGAGSIIRNVHYLRCDLETVISAPGQGAPIWIENRVGTIQDVTVTGGRLRAIIPEGGLVSGPTIHLKGVAGFKLSGTVIEHFSRTLLEAIDCPDLLLDPLAVKLHGPVPPSGVSRPYVHLMNCARADIRTAKLAPAYAGQLLL